MKLEEEVEESGDVGSVIALLRATRHWSQTQLADASGVAQSSISEYELGKKEPHFSTLERLLTAMGYHLSVIDEARGFLSRVRDRHTFAAPGDRAEASALWKRLMSHSHEVQLAIVREAEEFKHWALSELLALESTRTASSDPKRALELAELSVSVADAIPGSSPWLSNVRAFAYGHLGNTRKVLGDLGPAEAAYATADRFLKAGKSDKSGLVNLARVFGMKAALRRDQRRFSEAISLLDQALALEKGPHRATLLAVKATVLEESDDPEGAIVLLREAATIESGDGDPRLPLVIRHNLVLFLSNSGHHRDARALLPEVSQLARSLGSPLDRLRLRWVEGKILSGLHETERAVEILTKVRTEFSALKMHYDMALATLELASLYAREGRVAEVKSIARHLVPVFQAQDVHREALAALSFFRQAAEREKADDEIVSQVHAFLTSVRRNPDIKWETPKSPKSA
jgi:transcriptional regulator with XRE-family HTH domain